MVPPNENLQRSNEIKIPRTDRDWTDSIVDTARKLEPGQSFEKAGRAIRELFKMPEMSETEIIRDTRYDANGYERDRAQVERVIEDKFISRISVSPQPGESDADYYQAIEDKRQEYREVIGRMLDEIYAVRPQDMASFFDGSAKEAEDKYYSRVVERALGGKRFKNLGELSQAIGKINENLFGFDDEDKEKERRNVKMVASDNPIYALPHPTNKDMKIGISIAPTRFGEKGRRIAVTPIFNKP